MVSLVRLPRTITELKPALRPSSTIHSCEKIRNDLKEDVGLLQDIQQVRVLLNEWG